MRKIFLIYFFCLLHVISFCAARFWVGGGSSANWNAVTPTNWSATSGGSNNASVPTSSDDVTFDGAGATGNTSCTITAGASTLSLTFTSGYTATITINANFTISVAGNFTDRPEHTWTNNSVASSTLNITAASTITSNGKTFPGNVQFSNANTKTLSGDWTISGTLTVGGNTTITSNILSCAGIIMTGTATGTATIRLTGGTWSGSAAISNNLTFAGNVTVSGTTLAYSTGTITYSSGTITTTGSKVSVSSAAVTFNTNGMTWNDIVWNANQTITINSLLSANTFTIGAANVTFSGTAGWTVGTFTDNAVAINTITLANSITYTITSSFQAFQTRTAAILLFTSDHATNQAILTLQQGAICSLLADFTRIDASAGRTINTFHGTLTSCTNIYSYTDLISSISASYLFCQ